MSGAVGAVMRVELRKLAAQRTAWVLLGVAALAPLAFAALIAADPGANPGDTLLGADVHLSGFAVPLVSLAFAASFGFPLAAALLSGDLFAAEDRHDTWKALLTRGVDRRSVFVGKCLAVGLVTTGLWAVATVVAIAGAVLLDGAGSSLGLSGQTLSPAAGFGLCLAAWALSLAPLLAFVAIGILAGVAARSGVAGVAIPVALALIMQVLAHVGNGGVGHQLLLLAAFDAWHGLLTRPLLGTAAVGVGVSLVWGGGSLWLAWRIIARRDFDGGGPGARSLGLGAIGLTVLLLAMVGSAFLGPTPATPGRLAAALSAEFPRLAADQTRLVRGPNVRVGGIDARAQCARRGGAPDGAGDDWVCVVSVRSAATLGVVGAAPLAFDLSVDSGGCFKATGDPQYVGAARLELAGGGGRRVPNPLFAFYGCLSPF